MSASHHQGPAPSSHSLGDTYPDEDVKAEMSDDGMIYFVVAQEERAAWSAMSGVQPDFTRYSRYDDEQEIEPRGKKEPAPSPTIKPEFEKVSQDPFIETYIGHVTRQFPDGKRDLPVSLKGTKRSQRSTGTTLAGGDSAAGQKEGLERSRIGRHSVGTGRGSGYGEPPNANSNGWARQSLRDDGRGSRYTGDSRR